MIYNTIKDATMAWVAGFDAIPIEILYKLGDFGEEITEETPYSEKELENLDTFYPMWGTLWSPSEMFDQNWIEENLEKIKDCGFRIYHQEDYGYILGIDGAGYDFYESHWIPLYEARGLHWHE